MSLRDESTAQYSAEFEMSRLRLKVVNKKMIWRTGVVKWLKGS